MSPADESGGGTLDPAYLTARDAAGRLGVDERTVRRAIARGDLAALKRAGVFQIAPSDLDQYQRRRTRAGGAGGKHVGDRAADRAPGPPSTRANLDETATPGRPPAPARRGALPVAMTSLVGRASEIAALVRVLRDGERLLTLTGPGGVGKTRLAVAAASAVAGDFTGGVWFVGLAGIADPGLVAQTIAHELGVREAGGETIVDRLTLALGDRRCLLVLDNFEQVVEAAPLIARLLAACPRLRITVTSRVRLRLAGERAWPVPPLGLAAREAGPGVGIGAAPDARAGADNGTASDAVRLFEARAQAVRGDRAFTADERLAVAAMCHRLDGLPLAIELAAARMSALSPEELLARLEPRLPLLTGGPRDAPRRLRTMRDAIAWSHDLLSEPERALFRRLAVFTGGFTLDAAGSVADTGTGPAASAGGDDPAADLVGQVASLVDQSQLRADPGAGGVTRYQMLETIREFGLEQLAASGEADAVRQRHAAWCLAFAGEAGPRAKQPGAARWVDALEREHPNLRAALSWYASQGDGVRLVQLAGAVWPFWHAGTYFEEGRRWLELALELGHAAPPADRIRALTGAGTLAWYQTRVDQALIWHEEALALARATGDRAAEAFSLINLSAPAMIDGDYDLALARLEAGLAAARAVGETEAASLALYNLACLAWLQGDFLAAQRRAEEALALARSEGWDWLLSAILGYYGVAMADLGELDRAAALLWEALSIGQVRGNALDVAVALAGLARVRAGGGQTRQAVVLFGAAAALRDETGTPESPVMHAYYAPFLAAARRDLGPDRFAAAWADGQVRTGQAAVEAVLAAPPPPGSPPHAGGQEANHGLTRRERDILRRLALGESNREISEHLYIAPATVASHVARIYRKLGVNSRAKASVYAHRHGLA